MILAGCLQSRLLTWWLLIHVNCKCSKLLLRRSPVPGHQGGLGLSSGNSLYCRELVSLLHSYDSLHVWAALIMTAMKLLYWLLQIHFHRLIIVYAGVLSESDINVTCPVPVTLDTCHVSRSGSQHCYRQIYTAPIRLSDIRALRNQMDCYSNCHGTCYAAATIVNWIKLWELYFRYDAHQIATKWKGDPLSDNHVPALYLEPSNTLSLDRSISQL